MSQLWGILKFLKELWDAIKVIVGMVEKAKHENTNKEISEGAGQAGNPDLSDAEREDAAKKLEDIANRRT